MDNFTSRKYKPYTLDSCFAHVCEDSDNLFKELGTQPTDIGEEILIQTELPSRVDPDFLIGIVRRWHEIQLSYNRPLRIIAWSYNAAVEKQMLGLVQNIQNLYLTVVPSTMRAWKCLTEGQKEI